MRPAKLTNLRKHPAYIRARVFSYPFPLPNSTVLSSQVTGVTRSGRILGPGQRVSALDAVKSITISAAHQYFEQDRKGSIEVGKLADRVILSANPRTISPEKIKDIMVTETIKQGTTG